LSFIPLQKNILIERIIESKESLSGILLSTSDNSQTAFGTVTHISDEVTKVKVGDIIMFNVLMNSYIPVDDKKLLMMLEDDIYGKLSSGTKLNGVDNFDITHDNDVIVKVTTQDKNLTSSSGIVLTVNASALHDRPTNGVVIKVGPSVNTIAVGDKVEFEKVAGIDLTKGDDNTHFVLMDIEKIVGKYL
jgi:co-chaperonin GroES (HSP10)